MRAPIDRYLLPVAICSSCGKPTHRRDDLGPRHVNCLRDEGGRLLVGRALSVDPVLLGHLVQRSRVQRGLVL